MDAIDLLRADHLSFALRFDEFFNSRSESRRHEIIMILCQDVRIHLALESDVLLAIGPAGADVIAQTRYRITHERTNELIEEIAHADPDDIDFSSRVHELSRLVSVHTLEWERSPGLFREVERADIDLDALAMNLSLRRQELSHRDYGGS